MKTVKRISSFIALLVALGAGTDTASATLIGDTVHLGHYSPDTSTASFGGFTFANPIVVVGNSDKSVFYNSFPYAYNVNVEANSILVDYTYLQGSFSGTWAATGFVSNGGFPPQWVEAPLSFNGLGVTSLNDSSGNSLQGVTVDTNMVGWNSATMLSFGADNVFFDWKGLAFNEGTYFNATLDFGQSASPVPEPSTMLLLGGGLAGLAFWRRKSAKV